MKEMATSAPRVGEMHQTEVKELFPCETAPISKRQECVLLIEDSEDAMLLVQYALKEHGKGKYQLEWASSLSDGLTRMLQGGIDVVLLDLGLPESSGSLSYAWVREAAPETPVVVLTGDTREETELSVFSSGVEDYLVKDQISGSLLIKAISGALQKGKKRQHPKSMTHQLSHRFHWRPKD